MSAELEDLVQKKKALDWRIFKEKWFCKTESCKIPGLLKIGKRARSLRLSFLFSLQKKKQSLAHS